MNIYSLPHLLSSLVTIGLIYLIGKHSKDPILKRLGIAFCATVFWWEFWVTVLLNIKSPYWGDIISRIIFSGIILIPPECCEFFYYALTKKRSNVFKISRYLCVLFLPFLWFSDLFLSGYWDYFWGFYPKASTLHMVH